jgi:hypothetical protein
MKPSAPSVLMLASVFRIFDPPFREFRSKRCPEGALAKYLNPVLRLSGSLLEVSTRPRTTRIYKYNPIQKPMQQFAFGILERNWSKSEQVRYLSSEDSRL